MELGDLSHEMVHSVLSCRERHLALGFRGISLRFGEQAKVEVGIAALVAAGPLGAGIGGRSTGSANQRCTNGPNTMSAGVRSAPQT